MFKTQYIFNKYKTAVYFVLFQTENGKSWYEATKNHNKKTISDLRSILLGDGKKRAEKGKQRAEEREKDRCENKLRFEKLSRDMSWLKWIMAVCGISVVAASSLKELFWGDK